MVNWRKPYHIFIIICLFITITQFIYQKGFSYQLEDTIPHNHNGSIEIDSNTDFALMGFEGNGTSESPYLIENLEIENAQEMGSGIYVQGTTAHFIIRNCTIRASYICIKIRSVLTGTARIENNTCISIEGNGGGILLTANGCVVVNNTCKNFMQGIHLNEANGNYLSANRIENSHFQGINIRYSSNNQLLYNWIGNSSQHGIAIVKSSSSSNIIHHNIVTSNSKSDTYEIDGVAQGTPHSQGYDEGGNNIWYDDITHEGNNWSDYIGTGNYSIDGPAGSKDIYPSKCDPIDSSTKSETTSQTTSQTILQYPIFVAISTFGGTIWLCMVNRRRIRAYIQ